MAFTTGDLKRAFLLLKVGRTIKAEINERRQASDLPQGGLEVLCVLTMAITFVFSHASIVSKFTVRFDFHIPVLRHILILHLKSAKLL